MDIQESIPHNRTRATEKIYRYFTYTYFLGLFGVFATIKIGSTSFSNFIYPVLYLITLFFVKRVITKSDFNAIGRLVLLLFTGIFISSLCSYNPAKSIQSLSYLVFNLIFAYWLFKTYSINEIFKIVLRVLLFVFIVSLILLLIYPPIVIYNDPLERASVVGLPNFKGLFPHKIHAGIFCALGYFLSLYFYKGLRKKKFLYFAALFFLGVLISGSSLAFITFFTLILVRNKIKFIISSMGLRGLLFFVFVLSILITIAYKYDLHLLLIESSGRDATLTGRTVIWAFGSEYISAHPWLGGGFEIFFDENLKAPANALWNLMPFYSAPSFHNGYIEILAESGIIGASAFLILLFSQFYKALKANNILYLSIFVLFIIANSGAAMLIKPNNFFFTFLIYCFFENRYLKQLKNRSYSRQDSGKNFVAEQV